MKLFTTRSVILNVAKQWRKVYGSDDKPGWEDKQIKARALERLDLHTATAEEINEIIGNSSWTRIGCHECGKDVEAAVEVGQEPDYESSTATFCFDCIHAAHKLFPLGTFKS